MQPSDSEKPYRLAVLRDRDGDLNKEWFIEFYACTRSLDMPIRKRIKIPTKYDTEKARRKFAREQIIKINALLAKGYLLPDKNFKEETTFVEATKSVMLLESLEIQIEILQHLRPKSAGTYQSAVNSAKLYFKPDIPIQEFTTDKIYKLRDFFITKLGNNPVTANKKIYHLDRVFKEVRKRNGVKENPFKEVDKLVTTQVSSSNIAFTKGDQETLESYMREHDPDLLRFTRYMYYAFIRPKELRNLKIKFFKLDEKTITVPGEVAKNRKTRNIFVIRPLIPFLPEIGDPNHFVFGRDLKPGPAKVGENTPYYRHSIALRECNLEGKDYTLYSWRHTGAVNAYLSGVGIKELQNMFGHSSLEETSNYLKSLGLRIDPKADTYNW